MDDSLFSDQPAPKADDSLFSEEPAPKETGKLMSAFKGAANNIPLMPQAIAGGTSLVTGGDRPYSENLEQWNKEAGEAKKANPISYGTGAVLGAAAPLAIPGVGEAMEAAPVTSNALYGAANAISNKDLTKDLPGTLKEAGTGAVIGGAVGKAGEMIGNGLGALKSKLTPAAEHMEANISTGFLNLNSRGLKRLSEGLENPEKVANHVNQELNRLFPGFGDLTDTPGSKYQKLLDAHDEASSMIGQVIDATTAKGGALPEVDEAIGNLQNAASKYKAKTSPKNVDIFTTLNDARTDLEELKQSGQLTFENIYEVKKGIGESFNNVKYDNPGVDKAYGIVSDAIDKILDRVHAPDSAMKQQFDHAKDIFSFTSDLLPAMKGGVSRSATGVGGGLTNAGLATAGVIGHPLAWPALAVKNMGKYLAPDLGSNIAHKSLNAIKNAPNVVPSNLGQGLTQEVIDYINSKRGAKK